MPLELTKSKEMASKASQFFLGGASGSSQFENSTQIRDNRGMTVAMSKMLDGMEDAATSLKGLGDLAALGGGGVEYDIPLDFEFPDSMEDFQDRVLSYLDEISHSLDGIERFEGESVEIQDEQNERGKAESIQKSLGGRVDDLVEGLGLEEVKGGLLDGIANFFGVKNLRHLTGNVKMLSGMKGLGVLSKLGSVAKIGALLGAVVGAVKGAEKVEHLFPKDPDAFSSRLAASFAGIANVFSFGYLDTATTAKQIKSFFENAPGVIGDMLVAGYDAMEENLPNAYDFLKVKIPEFGAMLWDGTKKWGGLLFDTLVLSVKEVDKWMWAYEKDTLKPALDELFKQLPEMIDVFWKDLETGFNNLRLRDTLEVLFTDNVETPIKQLGSHIGERVQGWIDSIFDSIVEETDLVMETVVKRFNQNLYAQSGGLLGSEKGGSTSGSIGKAFGKVSDTLGEAVSGIKGMLGGVTTGTVSPVTVEVKEPQMKSKEQGLLEQMSEKLEDLKNVFSVIPAAMQQTPQTGGGTIQVADNIQDFGLAVIGTGLVG